MTTIKTPTPEEINEAAEKNCPDTIADWSKETMYKVGWKDAISWLQNYQTQQQGEVRSAEEIIENIKPFHNWRSGGMIEQKIIQAMHEFHNHFQTPASVGSENTTTVKQQVIDLVKAELLKVFGRLESTGYTTIGIVNAAIPNNWEPGQSSQPQPNAISVIEEKIAELSKAVKFEAIRNKHIIEALNRILTKLKK